MITPAWRVLRLGGAENLALQHLTQSSVAINIWGSRNQALVFLAVSAGLRALRGDTRTKPVEDRRILVARIGVREVGDLAIDDGGAGFRNAIISRGAASKVSALRR